MIKIRKLFEVVHRIMNRKTEIILAWVANGLSIMYLLLTGMSLIVMKSSENQQQYNDILKQFYGSEQNVTPDILFASMIISIGFLAFSTLLGVVGALIIKGRKNLAGCLFIAAAITGIVTMNFFAMILWIIVAVLLFSKKDSRHQSYFNNSNDTQNSNERRNLANNDNLNQNHIRQDEWDPEKELKDRKKDDPYIY